MGLNFFPSYVSYVFSCPDWDGDVSKVLSQGLCPRYMVAKEMSGYGPIGKVILILYRLLLVIPPIISLCALG